MASHSNENQAAAGEGSLPPQLGQAVNQADLVNLQQLMDQINCSITSMLEQQRRAIEAIQPELGSAMRESQRFFEIGAAYLKELRPYAEQAIQAVKEFEYLPTRVKEGLLALAEVGWYIDLEMPAVAIDKFKRALNEKPIAEINEALEQYFHRSLERIERDLKRRHPSRAKIISNAFAAHRHGNYDASIPLLFAQTDGICLDRTRCQLFRKGLSRYVAKTKLEAIEKAYLEPLLQQIPVKAGEHQRGPNFEELNRHAVMHGEVVTYGTKENSLKAISLLNYVSYALCEMGSESKEPEAAAS